MPYAAADCDGAELSVCAGGVDVAKLVWAKGRTFEETTVGGSGMWAEAWTARVGHGSRPRASPFYR